MKPMPTALTIAGSDSGGGAGIQADLKTFAVMGVHGMSAITSITAQNTREVRAIHDLPPEMVVAQIEAVADDLGVDAAKTGMLSNAGIIRAVARTVERYGFPLVVDPVMIAKSGAKLLRDDAIEALVRDLLPKAWVVTPNRMEAERLARMKIESLEDAREAAAIIAEDTGARAVIVKGGHLGGDYSVDVLYYEGSFREYKSPRIKRNTTHGTGCSFSAAIAAGLAKGRSIPEAVDTAKKMITLAIEYGLELGGGAGPVNPVAWEAIPAERFRVLEVMERALDILKSNEAVVAGLIPEVQTNLAMAIPAPYARTPLDVAAVPGRIGRAGDRLVIPGRPEFGVSSHMARAVLAAMRHDPSFRSAANIRYGSDVVEAIESLGIEPVRVDRREEPEEVKAREGASVPWIIDTAVEKNNGRVPRAIIDSGDYGKEPNIKILGRDAVEVSNTIVSIGNILYRK